ncbi:MAG: flippase [Chitinophagaceae bacterium]|nr:flippase [Chitinophagaceae bacterium]
MWKDRGPQLWYNFSYLGAIQVSNFILSLIMIPYVVSVLGAEGFGVIAVAQISIFYLSVLVDYGFNRSAIREVALFRNDRQQLSILFSTVIISRLLLSIIALVILCILVESIPLFRAHRSVYYYGFCFVLGQALLVNWFFQGMEKMKYNAISSLFSRLLFTMLVFVFIRNADDTHLYLFFMGAGNIVAGILSIIACFREYKLKWVGPSGKKIRQELIEGWHYTISNLSMTTIQYGGLFILRLFTNDLLVGYYSIAEKIYFAMKMMLDVFSQAAYPRVCLLVQEGRDKTSQFFRQGYVYFLGMVIAGASLIAIFAPWVIQFFVKDADPQTAFLLRVLCLALVIVCLHMPAALLLLAGNHKNEYMKIFTLGLLVCLVSQFLLAANFKAMGTVIAVLITESFITAGLYWQIRAVYKKQA